MTPLDRLVDVITTLRSPSGCPWDRAQTLHSMRGYLIEETYEVLEAINQPAGATARAALLQEELGDLLFNVLMLIRIASDDGITTLDQVADQIVNKMITRHPHVFASPQNPQDADAEGGTLAAWEALKASQKGRKSRMDGIPRALPALLRAHRQGEKAGLVGFDWKQASGVFEKMKEELDELHHALQEENPAHIQHEYGDLLMATASLGRHIGADPENALMEANDRFRSRFVAMENAAHQKGQRLADLSDEELDALWEDAKRSRRDP